MQCSLRQCGLQAFFPESQCGCGWFYTALVFRDPLNKVLEWLLSDPPGNVSVEWPSSPVLEGSYVLLSCNGSANPPADRYTWYRSRLNPGAEQGPNQGPLDLNQSINVSVSADAQYFCEVRNRYGAKNTSLTQMVVHCESINLNLPCFRMFLATGWHQLNIDANIINTCAA